MSMSALFVVLLMVSNPATGDHGMRKNHIILLTIASLLLATLSRADERFVSLRDLEQEALQNNPEFRMAAAKVESADKKKSLAAAMPDPMIGYMAQNVGSPFIWSVGKEDMSMQGSEFRQFLFWILTPDFCML
jgi:hypothetical protein